MTSRAARAKVCKLFWSDCSWGFLYKEPWSDPQVTGPQETLPITSGWSVPPSWLIHFSALLWACTIFRPMPLGPWMEVWICSTYIAVDLNCGVEGYKSFWDSGCFGVFLIAKAYGLECFDSLKWTENQGYTEKHILSLTKASFCIVNRREVMNLIKWMKHVVNNSMQIKHIN